MTFYAHDTAIYITSDGFVLSEKSRPQSLMKLMLSATLWIPLGWRKVKGVQSPTPNCTGAGVPLGKRGLSHSSLPGLWNYSCTFLLSPAAH